MMGPIRREKQRKRTSKHARKKRYFLVLAKLRELKEKGASVTKAIRQLQGEPVVQLQRLDDSAMHNRQEHRNYHSVYPQRGWNSYGRRRELDDVWMPNYDDDDFNDPNARWNDYAECSREMFRCEYPGYPRNRLNSHPNQYYNQYGLQNYTYSPEYSNYTWYARNKNPVRGRPQGQRGRIPTVTSTVTSETSRQSRTRILVDCDRNKPTIEKVPSLPGEDGQRLSCTNKEVVPEKSDISEIVAPSSVKDAPATSKEPDTLIQPDEPSTEGNTNTSFNKRLLPSLDPLCNPEFNVIVANVEKCIASLTEITRKEQTETSKDGNDDTTGVVEVKLEKCIASSAEVTRKEETATSKDGNDDTTGVVEIEVVIASYPEEATMLTDEIGDSREEVPMDCVDSDTETVYFEGSVVYDNEVTINNINTSSSFLNYKEPIQTAVDTSRCQSSNISIKRKSEDSSANKIKISKNSDNEKTESINNVNDNLSTDTGAKTLQVTHLKAVSEGNDKKESLRHSEVVHEQKGKTVVDGTVNSEKPQHILKKCKITKRRKTVHNTLSEQAESNHNNRRKRCKSEESDKTNLCRSEESDPSLIRITRSKGHEFGLDCKSLPVKFREHSKPTKSKHPRSTRTTQNSQSSKAPKKRRYRIIRDSSSDEESDMSAVSYNSSASEKRHKRPKQTSKSKVAAAIPAKTVDSKLQEPQVSASSHTRSSEPVYNNTSDQVFHKNVLTLDKKRNLVRLNEYQRTESVEGSSNVRSPPSRMDVLFGPHSDNEEMTIRWSPKPENLIWSPRLDDSDSPDCIFRFDEDAINSSSVSTSKSCKEKTEENIPKKVPWDHGLRTVCADSDDKKESKKTHHRVSLIQGNECSKKVDSRRASLSHNLTGKQESEKSINEHRRSSLGHDKDLIAERRCSLTPITNILPRNDKTNANKGDARTPGVSGNHTNNIQNNQHRLSATQNNSENKAEHKKVSNNLNGINKQNVTKIVDRRSSISHTSAADVKPDRKTVPISNKLETNNEQQNPVLQKSVSVENKKENKRPAIKQRQLSIDLKHATMNHLQGLTWESIIHLEYLHLELKSARQCQQPRKVKPSNVVLMPVVPVYDKFTTVKRPKRAVTNDVDSQPGSSAEPNIGSNRDVIDLCDSDDEQIRDINSINSLMRTVLDEKPITESNVTCSDAAAPSNEVALKPEVTTPTELGIQHSAVGASRINVTPTEIPVTIQCSKAMDSTSSCVPPILMKENHNKTRTELCIQPSAVGVSVGNVTPTEIQCSTATATTSLNMPPIVMTQSHNEAPTEVGIQHSAVGASRVNVIPAEIPDTMQCSTSIVPTNSGLPPSGIEETRNYGASTNVQNMQQDMPQLTITLINPRSAANASNVPMLCRRNSTTTITPISTVNIPVIQTTTNSASEIQAPSTLFTSAPNVASASRSTFNTRQVENIAPMLYNIENRSNSAVQAATTAAISSSNISMAQVQCTSVTAPILIRNEDFANTWCVPIVLYILMEQSINQLLSYYSSQYKISREDVANEFRLVLSGVSQSRTDLAGRLLNYLKTREIPEFNLKELVRTICMCCKAKFNFFTPPIGILKILVEIANEWNLLNSRGFLMSFARTVLQEWKRQYTASIVRHTAAKARQTATIAQQTATIAQQTATIAQKTAANTQKTRRASVIQNHNQPAQQGVPPQASIHMTTSAVESNQRQNSNQNLMNSHQKNRFLRQCQEYSRLRNELAIMLARQQQHSQLSANTPAQNVQQKCRRRGSAEVQRQSIDSSNIPGNGLRRQAQQRPMVSGIQPPIAHASSQASSVLQNQHSALQQLQQQISSISNHSIVPETPVRANVSWIPNQNMVPAVNASPSFAPPLPHNQQLRSLLRQTVPSEQPTQPPLIQPQTTRTFNPFPNDEFRIRLPLSQPLESTTAPHSITAASTWTPPAQVCNSSAAFANQSSSATMGDSSAAFANQSSSATMGDSSAAFANQSSSATMGDSSAAFANQSSSATMGDSSAAFANQSSSATMGDSSAAFANQSSSATMGDSSAAFANQSSSATMGDSSAAFANQSSSATMGDSSAAFANQSSSATMGDSSAAFANQSSSATMGDSSAAFANQSSSATMGDSSAAFANQSSSATVGDCINATIVKALGATSEAVVKDESSEDIIDVDEWFEKMNDDVVCLNPEYFSQVHIKYDMDQLIKADVNFDPLADNMENVEAQQQDANPPRIASVDSGFSSPPRQFEHPEVLSGERLCICSKRAEMVCKCRVAIYCSKQCQLINWPNHQPQCVRALSNLTADHCI